jgi:hypothetical protein
VARHRECRASDAGLRRVVQTACCSR